MTTTPFCSISSSLPSLPSFLFIFFVVFFQFVVKKLQCFSSINFPPFYQFATLKSRDISIFKLSWNLIPVASFKGHNTSFTTFATFSSFISLKETNKFGFSETKFIWLLTAIFLRQFYFFRIGIFLTNTWISVFAANFLRFFSFVSSKLKIGNNKFLLKFGPNLASSKYWKLSFPLPLKVCSTSCSVS